SLRRNRPSRGSRSSRSRTSDPPYRKSCTLYTSAFWGGADVNFSIIYVAYSTEIELRTFHSLLSLQNYHLETVTTNDSQAFRRIDARTLCHLMKSMSSQEFAQKYVLVDCRYPYEFNGGHIKVSHSPPPGSSTEIHQRIPIFYCEYSQKRGPSMAQTLRSVDRQRNVDVYPKVDFPEIYVIDKGYRNFFETFAESMRFQHLCEPCSYVEMVDCRFAQHLKQFNFHKKSWGNSTCSRIAP
ncbi:unnamed protein product, partial [Heligmosomoides polygyrus]|uniref:protein-tyrosine-phosphatase n=1 Tax=Heligmosomoides polygyrus TaxID=6339 RepID=A0A183FNL5_HELPZ